MTPGVSRVLVMVGLAAALAAGCGPRVGQRVDDARQAVEAARAGGAAGQAPEEFRAAERSLAESQAFLEAGDAHSLVQANLRAAVAETAARSALSAAKLKGEVSQARAEAQAATQAASQAAAAAAAAQREAQAATGKAVQAQATAEQAQTQAQQAAAAATEARSQAAEAVRTAAPPAPPAPTFDRYVVKKGDTLKRIAARREIYGDAGIWWRIYDANREIVGKSQKVRPGQVLLIPRP